MPVLPPLADVSQLGAILGQSLPDGDPRAEIYLDTATAAVRQAIGQQISWIPDDIVELDPVNGTVSLPELPVEQVSQLETFDGTTWTVQDPAAYIVHRTTGRIEARRGTGVIWPVDPGSWRVTYTHGYRETPVALLGVVLGVAARGYASPIGVDSERLGNYQVKYSAAVAFNPLEQAVVNRFRVLHVS